MRRIALFREKLIVYIKLNDVALFKAGAYLTALAVEFYALKSDILVQQIFRQCGHSLSQKLVHALVCIVFVYGKFFHANTFFGHFLSSRRAEKVLIN